MRRGSRKTLADILTAGCPACEGRMLIASAGWSARTVAGDCFTSRHPSGSNSAAASPTW